MRRGATGLRWVLERRVSLKACATNDQLDLAPPNPCTSSTGRVRAECAFASGDIVFADSLPARNRRTAAVTATESNSVASCACTIAAQAIM